MRNILFATFLTFTIPAMADTPTVASALSAMPPSVPEVATPPSSINRTAVGAGGSVGEEGKVNAPATAAIPSSDPVVTLHMAVQPATNGLLLSMENESAKPSTHMDMAITPLNAEKLRNWLDDRYPVAKVACGFFGLIAGECWTK